MSSHTKTVNEIIEYYSSNEVSGLTSAHLAEQKTKYGPNKLKEKKRFISLNIICPKGLTN